MLEVWQASPQQEEAVRLGARVPDGVCGAGEPVRAAQAPPTEHNGASHMCSVRRTSAGTEMFNRKEETEEAPLEANDA